MHIKKVSYKESDMYEPIRSLLNQQGFVVRGEVKGCDIAAVRDDILWVVEMKLSANITLLYQAIDRQTATGWVFVAIPRPSSARDKNYLRFQKLLKKLQLGLITVALDSPIKYAEIVMFPVGKDNKKNKKTETVKREIAGRTVDTVGGITKTKINTAFKERCIKIACLLNAKGELSVKELVELGCAKNTSQLLQSNILGWFNRVKRGVYSLSDIGHGYLKENASSTLVVYYKMKAEDAMSI